MKSNKLKHVAIIMDGNGRWAAKRNRVRTFGHQEGAVRALEIVEHAARIKLPVLTVWGFATTNWKRSEFEVNALMSLFERFGHEHRHRLSEGNIRTTFIGRHAELPNSLQRMMDKIEDQSANNTGMLLRPAINFSGQQETVDAVNRLLARGEPVTDESLEREIWGATPPYDLVIRTGGDTRVSGWPVGQAELYFTDTLWPDFTTAEFDHAVEWFDRSERRFGAIRAA